MNQNKLYLSEVCEGDRDLLYRWANDPGARKYAFHQETIPYSDHIRWFEKKLQDADTFLYIMRENDNNIGQVRIEFEETYGVISYSIDASYRGRGYAKRMLQLLEDRIKEDRHGENSLILAGLVKYENIASRKVFEALHYVADRKAGYIEYKKHL